MIDIIVPTVGESISEVALLKWTKKNGDYVDRDEVIAELESEKATFEVNAEKAGSLKTGAKEGDTLKIGDVLASIDETAVKPEAATKPAENSNGQTAAASAPKQEAKAPQAQAPVAQTDVKATPVASAIIADKKVDPSSVTPSGAGGKILKNDVLDVLNNPGKKPGQVAFSREGKREKMS